MYCKLPEYFLNMGCLFGYYNDPNHAGGAGPTFGESDSMFSDGVIATREIKASMDAAGGSKQSVANKLPFKVLSNFIDPYHPDGNQTGGSALRSYPHEKNPPAWRSNQVHRVVCDHAGCQECPHQGFTGA